MVQLFLDTFTSLGCELLGPNLVFSSFTFTVLLFLWGSPFYASSRSSLYPCALFHGVFLAFLLSLSASLGLQYAGNGISLGIICFPLLTGNLKIAVISVS